MKVLLSVLFKFLYERHSIPWDHLGPVCPDLQHFLRNPNGKNTITDECKYRFYNTTSEQEQKTLPVVLVIQRIRSARVLPEHLSDLLVHGTQKDQEDQENPDTIQTAYTMNFKMVIKSQG